MADGGRHCTECDEPVSGRALTCSATCRKRRSVRIRTARTAGRPLDTIAGDDAERAAQEILRDELKPVIREALTEDVLSGIRTLVQHLPKATTRLVEDLDSTDELVRQRAYMELLKRTVGNQNIVPDVNADKQQDVLWATERHKELSVQIIERAIDLRPWRQTQWRMGAQQVFHPVRCASGGRKSLERGGS